jgi:hypothetical protein
MAGSYTVQVTNASACQSAAAATVITTTILSDLTPLNY